MAWLATTALWALGFVFAYSAAVKLRNVRATAMALVDLGVTRRARAGAGLAAGVYETTLAAALFGAVAGIVPSRLAAGLAVLTLVAFSALLVRVIRSGEQVECFCFGSSSKAISSVDVARNAALIATGVTAMAGPASSAAAHVPSAPVTAAAALLGTVLIAAALSLRSVNADPLGDDLNRWEQRAYGN